MQKYWFIFLVLLLTIIYSSFFSSSATFSYDVPPLHESLWKEVDIVYNKDFPYQKKYDQQNIKGCMKTYISSETNDAVNVKKNRPVLRCLEHIRLLRDEKTICRWMHTQHEKHFFPLTLQAFGIIKVHARINSIHSVKMNNKRDLLQNKKTKIVTGVFERHEINIKKYTFKNITTGEVTVVNATPDHPVYVTNRATFIPIDLLLATDLVLNSTGRKVRLICSQNRTEHCGESLQNHVPVSIYNLEIDHNHTYFVSQLRLLVHNICGLAKELNKKIPGLIRTKSVNDIGGQKEVAFLHLHTHDDTRRALSALKEIQGDNIRCDTQVILSSSEYQHRPLAINALECFLSERAQDSLCDEVYMEFFSALNYGNSLIPIETENAFDTILPIAREQPVVAIARKHGFFYLSR